MTARTLHLRSRWLERLAAAALLLAAAPAIAAGVLDKARETSQLSFGYRADLRPFSHADGGAPAGYSIALCQRVADAVKSELKLADLKIEWVPVTAANRFEQLQQRRIDADCGADTPTLGRREGVDFSIPIALAGIGAVMRIDGDRRVRDVLSGRSAGTATPLWRGHPGDLGGQVTFAVVGGTTIERDLLQALAQRRITVTTASVPDYAAGARMVLERRAAALFGDRPVLLDAAQRAPAAGQLVVLERRFSREAIALALPRGDDDFRLLVDRTLSRLYRSPEFAALYASHFGAPDAAMLEFFQLVALPE
jgi:ABC-type amino acid transport substrate-binding protein